ncbi:hypothetical protein C8R42DRAFT_715334 [Lentinula raphanica]|nr:hypothetical protein C8R42DRAFT_715334 [Lentinula raphanica]
MTRSTTASRVLAIFFVAAAISSGVLAAPTPAPGPSLESSIEAQAQALQAQQSSGVNPMLHRRELDESENVGKTRTKPGQPESLQELEKELEGYWESFRKAKASVPSLGEEENNDSMRLKTESKELEDLDKKVANLMESLRGYPDHSTSGAFAQVEQNAKHLKEAIGGELSFVGIELRREQV